MINIAKRLNEISHLSSGSVQLSVQANGRNPHHVRELIGEVYSQPVNNQLIKVCRAFVCTQDETPYTGVGWILHEGVSYCMICCAYLPSASSVTRTAKSALASGSGSPRSPRTPALKFSCSACGIVVCGFCSSHKVFICELCDNKDVADKGAHRVCDNCFAYAIKGKLSAIQCYNMVPRGLPLMTNDSARLHLQFMKYVTSIPAAELQARFNSSTLATVSRKAFLFGVEVEEAYTICQISSDRVCVDKARGLFNTVQRIYLDPPTPNAYSSLGWIIKSTAHRCMSCQKVFIGDDVKYHCKACGDVCCRHCTNYRAKIVELKSPFKRRVCGHCYDGANEVSVRKSHTSLPQQKQLRSEICISPLQHSNSHATNTEDCFHVSADDDSVETRILFGSRDRDSPFSHLFAAEPSTFDQMRQQRINEGKRTTSPNAFASFMQSLLCGCGGGY